MFFPCKEGGCGFLIEKYMDEAKRIFRYILPGLAFAIPTLIATFLAKGEEVTSWIRTDSGSAVLQFVGFFILSGGVGYLFSIVYYVLVWQRLDHLDVVRASIRMNQLEVVNFEGLNRQIQSNKDAWTVTQVLWCMLASEDGVVKDYEAKQIPQYYSNILSATATTMIALAMATIVSLALFCSVGCGSMFHPVLVSIEIGLAVSAWFNFRKAKKRWTREINSAIATALKVRRDPTKIRIVLADDQ
jgi:hypothetical protein